MLRESWESWCKFLLPGSHVASVRPRPLVLKLYRSCPDERAPPQQPTLSVCCKTDRRRCGLARGLPGGGGGGGELPFGACPSSDCRQPHGGCWEHCGLPLEAGSLDLH